MDIEGSVALGDGRQSWHRPREGTLVVGVHAGFVDTDLSAWTDRPKISAADVAEQTVRALADDRVEVLADEETRRVKAALSQTPSAEPHV
ncbi:hypothetical protein ACFRCW_42100 [Streptomyces sp. NPDC056653]|uniref:hypothetical protein n=1 Tax=Streptomyces sp. NPDC056653 TaxID=3345894 RepID=UPI0036BE97B9